MSSLLRRRFRQHTYIQPSPVARPPSSCDFYTDTNIQYIRICRRILGFGSTNSTQPVRHRAPKCRTQLLESSKPKSHHTAQVRKKPAYNPRNPDYANRTPTCNTMSDWHRLESKTIYKFPTYPLSPFPDTHSNPIYNQFIPS